VLRHHADHPLHFERLVEVEHVLAENSGVAARGRHQAGEHLDGRRLSGAIRSEKAIERAALDAQVYVIDGADTVELPSEAFSLDGRARAPRMPFDMRDVRGRTRRG